LVKKLTASNVVGLGEPNVGIDAKSIETTAMLADNEILSLGGKNGLLSARSLFASLI
jgi:hypothetical protein